MTSESILADVVLCIVLPVLLTAMASCGSAAAIYCNDNTLHAREDNGDKRAKRILTLLETGQNIDVSVRIFSAIVLGFSLLYGHAALLGYLAQLNAGSVLLRVATLLLVLLWPPVYFILSTEAPRRIAAYHPERFADSLIDYLRLICTLLTPFVWVANGLSSLVVRLWGQNPDETPHRVTEEEIRMLVDEGEERGTIEGIERRMINNIFEFGDRDVSEVMTHRTGVSAVPIQASLAEVTALSIETGYSRIPVYDGDIDNICGIAYIKDLLKYMQGDSSKPFALAQELRRPLYVPESSSCSDIFELFQQKKTQLAVVVDEYGGTYGIVTMEDLLETIFGSIEDEYDNEQSQVTEQPDGSYLLDGSLGVSELEQLLDMRVPDESNADTLSGFVTELLGGVPNQPGDCTEVTFGGVAFAVTQCDEKRILQLSARPVEQKG